MRIATIGFTKSSAEHFFERLRQARVQRLLDIRLHNESQLAGFAKGSDLPYFLERICGIRYQRALDFAPTEDILRGYQKEKRGHDWFEAAMRELLASRGIPGNVDRAPFERESTVLLCSEASPQHCHRRFVAELLAEAWGARVEHL